MRNDYRTGTWLMIAVTLLVGGAIGYFIGIAPSKEISQTQPLLEIGGAPPAPKQSPLNTIDKAIQDPDSKKMNLTDVTAGNSSGNAYILREDNIFFYSVVVSLPDLQAGQFYDRWAVILGRSESAFSTFKFNKQHDGTYKVSFSSSELYDGYDMVL